MNDKSVKFNRETPVLAEGAPLGPLDDLLAVAPQRSTRPAASPPLGGTYQGVVIGTLAGTDEQGRPLVDFPGNRGRRPMAACTTASLDEQDVGREVALMFEQGDSGKPVLLGVIQAPQPAQAPAAAEQPGEMAPSLDAEVDGRRVVLTADQEIVLRCGKASITLTRAGKILVRGAYLLSRSSGVNRIKGGSVQIN